jgi:raffinose/stachyose/melibiose transport system substrate-binding protein
MKKRTFAAVAVAAAIALAAAGCSGTSNPTAKAGPLTVWYNASDAKAFVNVFARYEKASGQKLKLVPIQADGFENQVQTRWAAGDRPDILEYQATGFLSLNPVKNFVPLTDQPFVAKSGDLYKNAGSYNKVVYAAITNGFAQFGTYFNKPLLSQYGLTAPKSYSDLEHICTVLKQKAPGVIPIWESGGSAWPTQILGGILYNAQFNTSNQYADQILSHKAKLSDPNGHFVEGLTKYRELANDGCFGPNATTQKYEDSFSALLNGKAAVLPLIDSFVGQFEAASSPAKTNATIGWSTPSATQPAAAFSPSLAGTYYVVKTGNQANEQASLKFVKWATSSGYQKTIDEGQFAPVIKGFKSPASFTGLRAEFQKTLSAKSSLVFNSSLPGFGNDFPSTMTGVLSGQQTPQQAGVSSQQQLQQGASAAGLKGW